MLACLCVVLAFLCGPASGNLHSWQSVSSLAGIPAKALATAPAIAAPAAVDQVPLGQWWETEGHRTVAGGSRVHAEAVAPMRAYRMAATAMYPRRGPGMPRLPHSLIAQNVRLQI
jgi:hypothetical protein